MAERYDSGMLKGVIEGWSDSGADNPPTLAEIIEMERDLGTGTTPPSVSEYETWMLFALEAKLVGMDGFKYCWPEVQRANWQSILRWKERHARDGRKDTP